VLNPQNRFATIVLALGSVVLLAAIGLGERMGDRVLAQATDQKLQSVQPVVASPDPTQSEGPYGPDWKRSETLSAAGDPRFPDPRIPPMPLPTRPPQTPAPATIAPPPTPTPNPNIPIWRQQGMPTPTPSALASPADSGNATAPPSAGASPPR
jgi:hypothetical protein